MMDKVLVAIQHFLVAAATIIVSIVSSVVPVHKNQPIPMLVPSPMAEQSASSSASISDTQPSSVSKNTSPTPKPSTFKKNEASAQTVQQTASPQPTNRTAGTATNTQATTTPSSTTSPSPSYTYKPCCTTASGEQVSIETVECMSYAFGGKSYDMGQVAQKIKDVTGLKLIGGSDTELNGGINGNATGITVLLYKTDAYDYSRFDPNYPGLKVVYHYVPTSCTDDLKQKITAALDAYKATLP